MLHCQNEGGVVGGQGLRLHCYHTIYHECHEAKIENNLNDAGSNQGIFGIAGVHGEILDTLVNHLRRILHCSVFIKVSVQCS